MNVTYKFLPFRMFVMFVVFYIGTMHLSTNGTEKQRDILSKVPQTRILEMCLLSVLFIPKTIDIYIFSNLIHV